MKPKQTKTSKTSDPEPPTRAERIKKFQAKVRAHGYQCNFFGNMISDIFMQKQAAAKEQDAAIARAMDVEVIDLVWKAKDLKDILGVIGEKRKTVRL